MGRIIAFLVVVVVEKTILEKKDRILQNRKQLLDLEQITVGDSILSNFYRGHGKKSLEEKFEIRCHHRERFVRRGEIDVTVQQPTTTRRVTSEKKPGILVERDRTQHERPAQTPTVS